MTLPWVGNMKVNMHWFCHRPSSSDKRKWTRRYFVYNCFYLIGYRQWYTLILLYGLSQHVAFGSIWVHSYVKISMGTWSMKEILKLKHRELYTAKAW